MMFVGICWEMENVKYRFLFQLLTHSLTHSLDATVVNSVLVTRLESRNAMQRRKVDGAMR